MSRIKIGIPLHGKMAVQAFHAASFRECLASGNLEPFYFLSPNYYENFSLDPTHYFELQTDSYNKYYDRHALLRSLKTFRRFAVRTETTDLRFRESAENMLFETSISKIAWFLIWTDMLRCIPNIGEAALWMETKVFPTHAHDMYIKEQGLDCVLTPGMGNYNFWNEGNFALEAQRLHLPAFAAITNYDNIVNMGFRGYTPRCLAVWSKQMADEAIRLQDLPANKIEITGPVQYDRFVQPLSVGREDFLRSIKLDPKRKTIFFAGGVNITRYFEMYRLLVENPGQIWREPFNLIVRPYPHVKVLGSPGWQLLEKIIPRNGVYLSDPGSIDASGDRTEEYRTDLSFEDGPDELSYLLRYSDVMINTFSTISLEAALCDLPVIHLGYDTHTFGQRYGTIAAFQQRQTHNRRNLRLSASKVAKSETQLISFLETYLGDKTIDRDPRLEYAISECGELDGKAGNRLVEMIMGGYEHPSTRGIGHSRMTKTKIVASLLIKNEDVYIDRVIRNIVEFCDHIIVTDNRSEDRTLEIVKGLSHEFRNMEVQSIDGPADSALALEPYIDTPTWIFEVDGDEVFDPIGLKIMRQKLLNGEFNKDWSIFPNTLHCTSIDLEKSVAKGYLAPPSRGGRGFLISQ